MNEYGVMQGSILVVQVKEAHDVPAQPCYVEVALQDQRQSTQIKPEPVWNEKFSFDVVTGKEVVIAQLCVNEFAGRKVLGSSSFELVRLLPPEYTFEDWLTMRSEDDKQPFGRIRLSLQWIVSRVEFFTNLISRIDKEIADRRNELGFHEEKLTILQRISRRFTTP